MSLPKLTIPTYFLNVPSTKKKIKYRPFLSKEEKIMMMVKNSTNNTEILQSMKEIIDVCTFKKLDMNKLAIFDIEYIFLQLRSKSVGEIIEIEMKCINEVESLGQDSKKSNDSILKSPCNGLIPISIDINDINVNFPKEHTNIINLEKHIGITMRYPSINDVEIIENSEKNDTEILIELISNIFDKDNVYEINDISKKEIEEFVDDINHEQMEDIKKKFFFSMPQLEHTIKYECPKCKNKGEYTFKGTDSFF